MSSNPAVQPALQPAVQAVLQPAPQVVVNPNDPHVRDIGEWAVKEHNKETGNSLKFYEVSSGTKQVMAGVIFNLVLMVENGPNNYQQYEAKVREQSWVEPPRKLMSFRLIKK